MWVAFVLRRHEGTGALPSRRLPLAREAAGFSRQMRLPGNEQRHEQFDDHDDEKGPPGRAADAPGDETSNAAETDSPADDAKQVRLALDARDDPPDDDRQPDVPGRHEAVLAVQPGSNGFCGCEQRRSMDEPQRADDQGQQAENAEDELERALHDAQRLRTNKVDRRAT